MYLVNGEQVKSAKNEDYFNKWDNLGLKVISTKGGGKFELENTYVKFTSTKVIREETDDSYTAPIINTFTKEYLDSYP